LLLHSTHVWTWHYVCYDEAQRLKNWQSAVSGTARRQHSYAKLLLTGTPLQNNLGELWALLRLLYPEVFNNSAAQNTFSSAFEVVKDKAGRVSSGARATMRPALVDAAHALLSQLMLRRTKASVQLDLPPKTERLMFVPLSPLQHEAYKAVLAADAGHLVAAGGGGGGARPPPPGPALVGGGACPCL